MISILLTTPDDATAQFVIEAFGAHGWWVTQVQDRQGALRSAADKAPGLVLVDGSIREAADLVRVFATRNGGPGVLLLAPEGRLEETMAAMESGADEVVELPAKAEKLFAAASRVMELPHRPATTPAPETGELLTSEDIFGSVLLEVDGDSVGRSAGESDVAAAEVAEPEASLARASDEPVGAAAFEPPVEKEEPASDQADEAHEAHEAHEADSTLDEVEAVADEGPGEEIEEGPDEVTTPAEAYELEALGGGEEAPAADIGRGDHPDEVDEVDEMEMAEQAERPEDTAFDPDATPIHLSEEDMRLEPSELPSIGQAEAADPGDTATDVGSEDLAPADEGEAVEEPAAPDVVEPQSVELEDSPQEEPVDRFDEGEPPSGVAAAADSAPRSSGWHRLLGRIALWPNWQRFALGAGVGLAAAALIAWVISLFVG